MKRSLTPQEKKALAYRLDHVEATSESRHGFRRAWPKKKARAHRLTRRSIRQDLGAASARVDADNLRVVAKRGKARPRKWGATPLGEHVSQRKQVRLRRAGERVAKRNARLPVGLRNLLVHQPGENKWALQVARELKRFLRAGPTERRRTNRSWYVFFRDHPEWEGKVAAWLLRGARRRRTRG
jgi:hypothetical protein